MAKKKPKPPPEDGPPGVPEWVVTYGDMMSLLLTFFIMLVSMSEIRSDTGEARAAMDSIRQSFGPQHGTFGVPGRSTNKKSAFGKMDSKGHRSEGGVKQASHDSVGRGGAYDPSEIAALMDGGGDAGVNSAEASLDQAQANLAAAVAPEIGEFGKIPSELGEPSPFAPGDFAGLGDRSAGGVGLNALRDVEFDLHIELGRTDMMMEEVLSIKEGAVVPLDKLAGDPVDIIANGRLIARGEVLVLNDNFCVRVAEILTPNF